jgi:Uma2 family endonuclease
LPTLLTDAPERPLQLSPPRKRWTREECATLESTGLFEREHLELVEGELISKMGKNRPHVISLALLHIWLQKVFETHFVNAEAPIDVSSGDNRLNEPEPDLIVLNRPFTTIVSGNPQPADLKLVVEISDTTLAFDLTTKAALYARAAIVEYWVLDVTGRRLIVHRNPVAGNYVSVAVYSEHESVAPLAAPDAEFRPAQAFAV